MATCRDCALYDLEAHRNSGGKIVVRKNKTALCLFDPSRLERKLPRSIKRVWDHEKGRQIIPRPIFMSPDDGTGCPQYCHIPRTHYEGV